MPSCVMDCEYMRTVFQETRGLMLAIRNPHFVKMERCLRDNNGYYIEMERMDMLLRKYTLLQGALSFEDTRRIRLP